LVHNEVKTKQLTQPPTHVSTSKLPATAAMFSSVGSLCFVTACHFRPPSQWRLAMRRGCGSRKQQSETPVGINPVLQRTNHHASIQHTWSYVINGGSCCKSAPLRRIFHCKVHSKTKIRYHHDMAKVAATPQPPGGVVSMINHGSGQLSQIQPTPQYLVSMLVRL